MALDEFEEGELPVTDNDPTLWDCITHDLTVGDPVFGTVIARRSFGVFVEIGHGPRAAAPLMVTEFAGAGHRRMELRDYPNVGESISARVMN